MSRYYIGIDPGNRESAIVATNQQLIPFIHEKVSNEDFWLTLFQIEEELISKYRDAVIGIECVASYGMPVGRDVFETAEWTGRIREILNDSPINYKVHRVYRKDVKLHLCGQPRAKDANIRQALIDRYEPTGGGKTPQIGIKSNPGPLFGFAKDKWAALAVAITVAELGDDLPIFN